MLTKGYFFTKSKLKNLQYILTIKQLIRGSENETKPNINLKTCIQKVRSTKINF